MFNQDSIFAVMRAHEDATLLVTVVVPFLVALVSG
jgi:hypothetical protein